MSNAANSMTFLHKLEVKYKLEFLARERKKTFEKTHQSKYPVINMLTTHHKDRWFFTPYL